MNTSVFLKALVIVKQVRNMERLGLLNLYNLTQGISDYSLPLKADPALPTPPREGEPPRIPPC
jgi:hypothetical protein